ncbi:hypothetical protein ACEWY4_003351 [Coilia grayii]|uniref:C2H2-type domain-containing protein n=1 Tax=Coilia grayii TaxID=363190 RepID=A0ABD1KQZ7_9TELE
MDTLMVNGINVQTQLSSIMDLLAKTAVTEIGKLINDCAMILRLEISQRTNENDSLRKRCELLENQLRAVRNGGGGGVQRIGTQKTSATSASNREEFFGEVRPMPGVHEPSIENVFGKEWCMNLWKDETNQMAKNDSQLDPSILHDEAIDLVDDEPEMILIKEEAFEDCQVENSIHNLPRNNKRPAVCSKDVGQRAPGASQPCEEDYMTYPAPADDQEQPNLLFRSPGNVPESGNIAGDATDSPLGSDGYPGFYPGNSNFGNSNGNGNFSAAQNQRSNSGDKKFSCMFCDKSFNYLSYLRVHVRRHSGEKPFGCNVCGKRFAQKTYLKLHERTHSGEKPYTCMECGKSFSQKSSLNVHLRSHTGEKPYSCLECGKSYAYKHGFNTHQCVG